MLQAILVDDEILALELLEAMLNEIGRIEVVGKFLSPGEGLEKAKQLQPDILFLDIEMPEMNGLRLAEQLEQIESGMEIVFVTAYDEYALKAFNVGAYDYILKPVIKERLQKTIQNISKRKSKYQQTVSAPPTQIQATFLTSFYLVGLKGEQVKWRTKKVKELCAYLILHGVPIHKDVIMEEIWPEMTSDRASKILHTTVYQLRKELKQQGFEDAIGFVNDRYSLSISVESDIQQINKILKSASLSNDEIVRLLELYHGHFLEQEDYPWSIEYRERLKKQVINTLEKYAASFSEQNLYKKIIEKLIELDPWEENHTSKLIQYYLEKGERNEATRILEKFKAGLWKELGIKTRIII